MKRTSMRQKKTSAFHEKHDTNVFSGGQKSGVNIEAFDPVFRKKGYNQVKKNVANEIDNRIIYNPMNYKKMKANAKKKYE